MSDEDIIDRVNTGHEFLKIDAGTLASILKEAGAPSTYVYFVQLMAFFSQVSILHIKQFAQRHGVSMEQLAAAYYGLKERTGVRNILLEEQFRTHL
jgi:hypothetical protein